MIAALALSIAAFALVRAKRRPAYVNAAYYPPLRLVAERTRDVQAFKTRKVITVLEPSAPVAATLQGVYLIQALRKAKR